MEALQSQGLGLAKVQRAEADVATLYGDVGHAVTPDVGAEPGHGENDEELAEVRDFLVGVFPLRFESTTGIAGAIEPLAIYGLSDDYWQTYRSNVESVSTEDVAAAAHELIRPDDALVLLTGDAARVRDEIEAAVPGPLEVVAAA